MNQFQERWQQQLASAAYLVAQQSSPATDLRSGTRLGKEGVVHVEALAQRAAPRSPECQQLPHTGCTEVTEELTTFSRPATNSFCQLACPRAGPLI